MATLHCTGSDIIIWISGPGETTSLLSLSDFGLPPSIIMHALKLTDGIRAYHLSHTVRALYHMTTEETLCSTRFPLPLVISFFHVDSMWFVVDFLNIPMHGNNDPACSISTNDNYITFCSDLTREGLFMVRGALPGCLVL